VLRALNRMEGVNRCSESCWRPPRVLSFFLGIKLRCGNDGWLDENFPRYRRGLRHDAGLIIVRDVLNRFPGPSSEAAFPNLTGVFTVKNLFICQLAALLICVFSVCAEADVFNMGPGLTSVEMVVVGNAGNAPDSTGCGAVPYTYQMGKYDVTVGQYCEFLNAVAKTDTYGLYNINMTSASGFGVPTFGISQNGSLGNFTYSVTGSYAQSVNCPIFNVTWGSAARFCNWLHNGQPSFPAGIPGEVSGSTETGAYTLNGDTTDLLTETRNTGATYFIPSEDEWYKAAYYKGGGTDAGYWLYPTRSDTPPSNVLSAAGTNNANFYDGGYTDPTNWLTPVGAFAASPGPYGTYDMGGNVWQWNETVFLSNVGRGMRGGPFFGGAPALASSFRQSYGPTYDGYILVGFRVASVPEPSTVAMLLTLALGGLLWWRRS
jgi:formylglycine-generating enzyme